MQNVSTLNSTTPEGELLYVKYEYTKISAVFLVPSNVV
jgi:hypothetical protein